MPHSKTLEIIKNLGYNEEVIQTLTNLENDGKKKLGFELLKKMGLPHTAIEQIKALEAEEEVENSSPNNQELLATLVKKCKRSLDAFSKKGIKGKIVFKKNKTGKVVWNLEAPYDLTVKKFYETNKKWFDKWASQGLVTIIIFDGTSWRTK